MQQIVASVLMLAPVLLWAQASPPPTPPPVRLGGDVVLNSLLVRVDPVYPAVARAAGVQGTVMVQVQISKEGRVTTQGASREPAVVATFLPVNFSIDPPPNASRLPAGKAVISGQVRHADGRPASTAFVFAAVTGAETPAVSDLVQADSTGAYRTTNLPPGSYRVQAGTATGPSTYYPGVANLNGATTVSVASDETDVVRIDFTIP
jgi:hypothetical protein